MASYEFTGKSIQEAVRQAAQYLKVAEDDFIWEVLEEPTKGFLGFGGKDGRIRVTLKEESFSVQDLFNRVDTHEEKDDLLKTDLQPEESPEEALVQEEPSSLPEEPVQEETMELEVQEDHPEASETDLIIEDFTEESPDYEDEDDLVDSGIDPIEDAVLRFLSPVFDALDTHPLVRMEENDKEIRINIDGDHVGLLIGRRGDTLRALQLLLSVVIHREVKTNKRVLLDIADYKVRRAESLEGLAKRMADKARKSGRKVRLDPMNPAERRLVHLALEKEPGVTTYSEGKDPYRRIVVLPEEG